MQFGGFEVEDVGEEGGKKKKKKMTERKTENRRWRK
jgi:hypothetical protein